ncbi:MAG: glutamyl-tRNA reductase [Cytophagales bacterium]
MSNLKAISLTFTNTPIGIRELFSFDEQGCKTLLLNLREKFDLNEVLVVSTCNRTEVYYVSEVDINAPLIAYLIENTEVGKQGDLASYFSRIVDNNTAVKYLFEVSAGLHAQIVGDIQIAGQIKDAYQWSADLNMAGAFLHRLMHSIFYTNKKITQETSFRDGAASISYAATELIDDVLQSNRNARILLIGAGEIGEDTAKNLFSFGFANIVICNRTFSKAEELASKIATDIKLQILPFELLLSHIKYFDVIISAVQVEAPIIDKVKLADLQVYSHKYFVDLAVPRSIDADIESLAGVILYNIEDLSKKTTQAQQKRIDSIPHVESIIEESVYDFLNWSKEMEVSPTIHKIKSALETIRTDELKRFQKQLTENELKMVETITKNMMQKIIKLPVVHLKAACKRGEQDVLIDVLNELFDLENQKVLY